MIKRTLAILLFTVSSIVLLAHSAVPHHHHGSAVCFKHSHCTTEDPNQDNHSTGHSHDQNTPGTEESCILNQVFITPANQVRPEPGQLNVSDGFFGATDTFTAIMPADNMLHVFQDIAVASQVPFPDFFCHRAVRSLSLRAPPIV